MSIIKSENLFVINTKTTTYALFLDQNGYLRHLYYGPSQNDFDIDRITDIGLDWANTYFNYEDKTENIFPDRYNSMASLMEIAHEGNNDKKGSTISFRQNDGSFLTQFECTGSRQYNGYPELKDIPNVHDGKAESLEFTLVDPISKVTFVLTYTVFEDSDIIIRTSKLTNTGKESVNINRMMSLTLDLPRYDLDLMHFHGDWSLERTVERNKIQHGTTIISSRYGRTSHVENTFFIVLDHNANEESGECYGFNLVWSGNFKAEVTLERNYETRINYGINDDGLDFLLKSGETVELPQAIFAYSNSGINNLSQNFHDFIRRHICPARFFGKYRSILFNSWEGCYMDFNTESILEYMNCAKEIGAELFVLDDGWFGQRNTDSTSLGDWTVNKEKIDLKAVIDHCHSLGMKFGLWFEPEMISFNSELYRKHPEYALSHQGPRMCLGRHQFVLDTANKDAVDDIVEQVNKILDEYDIDYVKWDNNREVADNYSNALSSERQGSVDYLMTLGVFRMFREIVEAHPDIFFEGCASGGGKFDLGVLSYFPQIWCSDETDPVQRLSIQYGTSYGYPLSSISSHVSKCPITSYKTKSNIAFFGTYGYEFNPTKLTPEEKEELKENEDRYHRIHKDVILNGTLYRVFSPFEGNYFGQFAVSKDQSKALFLFANFRKEGNRYRFIRLKGLKSDAKYWNSYDNKEHTGSYYENIGLNFYRWFDEFTSVMVEFKEVK